MADNLAPVPAVPPAPTTSLAQTALHYAAGAGLLALAAWGAQTKLIDAQLFAMLLTAAAVGVGFKLKG